jgi:hypothetical protein
MSDRPDGRGRSPSVTTSPPLLRAAPGSAALASVPRPAPRPLIMVLGMHRSGTSLCSHMLSALGVDMADRLGPFGPPSPDNARGHWERWEIVGLHDRVLELLNRRYFDPTHDLGLPVAWWADPAIVEVRRDIVAFLRERMGDTLFGFKDPRTIRLLPLWHQMISELKLTPKFIFCLRNPAQVARSLQSRDGLAAEIGEARWFAYVVDFFRYRRGAEFCLVEYETWFDNPAENINKLCTFLELDWQQSEADLDVLVSGIIDGQLRHDDASQTEARQPLVRSLYRLARRAESDRAARDQIETLIAQFIGFQQLHSGIYRDFEQMAATAASLPAVEQEAAALRQAVAERDAAIAQSQGRADEAEAARERAEQMAAERAIALAAAEGETGELRGMLAQLEQQRQERETALAASQGEISRLHETLAQLEQQRQEWEAALAASRNEISRLHDMLMQVELQRHERETELAAGGSEISRLLDMLMQVELQLEARAISLAVSQGEISSLRELLLQADRREQERESAMLASEAELVGLRDGAARAAQLEREFEVAASELRNLRGLRDELAAARQVERALLDALREPP